MFEVKNFLNNSNIGVLQEKGQFTVIEHYSDLSVSPEEAAVQFYMTQMKVRRRQLVCDLLKDPQAGVTLQAGAMQWMVGDVLCTTGIKGAGDLVSKAMRGKVTGESAIKPEYSGSGLLITEPTYKHLMLVDLDDWNGGIVVDDGLFLACDSAIKHKAVMRSNISSALAGGEGLFNLSMFGHGIICLELKCPEEELIVVDLKNDVIKIDGNMAVAWSRNLEFTVERAGRSLLGSAASGEGLVNVYRGTGRIMMQPLV